jgi:recombination protein RecA
MQSIRAPPFARRNALSASASAGRQRVGVLVGGAAPAASSRESLPPTTRTTRFNQEDFMEDRTVKGQSSDKNAPGSDKSKALAAALSQIEKQFGKGSIMRLGAGEVMDDIDVVSTGSLGLDIALGIGGLPRGRVVEIYGPESSGKTTLTLQVIAEMQKLGGTAAFIDAEHALDPQYAQKLGVQLTDLLISQPDTGEQALEICDALVRSGSVDLIVIDSVAALTPKAEIEGEMGDSLPGLQARLMSQALRKLTGSIKRTNTLVIFINQIRMKIGVMFGNPETTTGGNALKFYASVRLDIRRTGSIKKGEEVIGSETKVKVVKNKVAPPFKVAQFDILYGEGISREGEVVDLGAELDIVEKSGSWYSYGGDRIGQGKDNAREYLRTNPDVALEIENKVREAKGVVARGAAEPAEA